MAFTLKPIKPKARVVDFPRAYNASQEALEEARNGALADFQKTTATWEHEVTFSATRVTDGYAVGTDDEIYGYVDQGTPAHDITPKSGGVLVFGVGGSPKTRPRVIGSSGGSKGSAIVRTRRVRHPGTDPRDFSAVIAEKWRGELPLLVAEKIGGSLGD